MNLLDRYRFRTFDFKFKKPSQREIIFYLFLLMVLFIPFTKISIPAVGGYEVTVGDFLLLVIASFLVYSGFGIKKSLFSMLALLLLLIFVCLLSSVMVIDWRRYFLSILPFTFSTILCYVTFALFSDGNLRKKFIMVKNVLLFGLVLSAIPAYVQINTGVKVPLFYDMSLWRYTFLTYNPNQYGVCFVVFVYIIILTTIKFQRNKLGILLLFQLFFSIPCLFSGSRSTLVIYVVTTLLLLAYYFFNTNFIKKISIILIIVFGASFAITSVLDVLTSSVGQINRGLSVFEKLESEGTEFEVGGPSGRTITTGKRLYKENPVLGVGLGNKIAHSGEPIEIHNTFLLFLAETGTLGFIAFISLFLITPLYTLFSRSDWQFKLMMFAIYGLFAIQNVPGMLLRQRWVWLFLCLSFVMVNVDKKGIFKSSRLSNLN